LAVIREKKKFWDGTWDAPLIIREAVPYNTRYSFIFDENGARIQGQSAASLRQKAF